MALQVWLPLNEGTLENRGLSTGVSITNNGATVDANGKTGSCYYFDGTKSITLQNLNFINGASEFSIALWVKTTAVSNTQCLLNYRNSVGTDIALFIIGGAYRFDVGGTQCTFSSASATTNWTHIACTFNKGRAKIYVNGTLTQTTSTSNQTLSVTATKGTIGLSSTNTTPGSGNALTGYIDDYRLYDHCLSPLEVKELSRGLVAHYKLDSISISSVRYIKMIIKGSKSENGYQLSNIRLNSGTSNYNWSGATITSSHEATNTEVSANLLDNNVSTKYYRSITNHTEVTLTIDTGTNLDLHTYRYLQWDTANDMVGRDPYDFEFYMSGDGVNWVLVDKQTSYAGTDARKTQAYSLDIGGMFGSNTVWDCSGYGHDGIVLGTFATNSSSPRYENCTVFNGTNSAINIGRYAMVEDTLTVNIWAYMDDWSQYGQAAGTGMRIASCTETGGWNFEPSGGCMRFNVYTGSSIGYTNPTDSTPLSSLTPGWHMWTGIFYGSGKKTRLLRDGVQVGVKTWANTSAIKVVYNASNAIIIGAEPASSPAPIGNYFNGKMSDFRIYATALSDADITELYKNTAHVSRDASICDREFIEAASIKVDKTGIIEANTLLEYDTNLLYDTNIYTEPDGSKWVRVFHHNNPADDTTLFTKTMDFEHGCYVGENSWFNFNVCKSFDHYEFLVKQTITAGAAETKYRFVQATNPFNSVYADVAPTSTNITRITTSGYSTSTTSGGFYKNNGNTYFVAANSNSGNWYGAAGSWTPYSHRLPGYSNGLVTTGYMDVYLRIDNGYGDVDIARIYKGNNLASSRFIEI